MEQHTTDLEKAFKSLRKCCIKLNLSKYTFFRVTSKKFLGFMVIYRGIETNPKKIKAILERLPLRIWKEV